MNHYLFVEVISLLVSTPQMAMAASNSVCRSCNIWDTAAWPPMARAKKTGLPIPAAAAPRARALRTSVPRRIPPSKKTGTQPATAATTSCKTSTCRTCSRQPCCPYRRLDTRPVHHNACPSRTTFSTVSRRARPVLEPIFCR
jgi:hypothetical protein